MEDLKELIKIVSKSKIKKTDVIGFDNGSYSNVQRLYDLIADSKIKSEEAIATYFFPQIEEPLKARYFSNLKGRLHHRLINTLFLIEGTGKLSESEGFKAYQKVYRNLAATKILLAMGSRNVAIKLARKSLKLALKYEYNSVAYELVGTLRRHYSTIEGNLKMYTYYKERGETIKQHLLNENYAEECYSELAVFFASKSSYDLHLKNLAKQFTIELRAIEQQHPTSYQFRFLSFLIYAIHLELENDYKEVIKMSDEAIDFFKSHPTIKIPYHTFHFILKKIMALIYLSRHEEAKKRVQEALKIIRPGTRDWFLVLDAATRNAFYAKNYNLAFTYVQLGIEQGNLERQASNVVETWRLFQAFLYYLYQLNELDQPIESLTSRFRLSRFMNEVPTYAKDKRGTNITILTLQILILLVEKKYADILDRVEPLSAYVNRHLRKNMDYRSNCFLKMLLQIPKGNFNQKLVKRKAKTYHEKLLEVPSSSSKQSLETEIIPYETLWELALNSLGNHSHKI